MSGCLFPRCTRTAWSYALCKQTIDMGALCLPLLGIPAHAVQPKQIISPSYLRLQNTFRQIRSSPHWLRGERRGKERKMSSPQTCQCYIHEWLKNGEPCGVFVGVFLFFFYYEEGLQELLGRCRVIWAHNPASCLPVIKFYDDFLYIQMCNACL